MMMSSTDVAYQVLAMIFLSIVISWFTMTALLGGTSAKYKTNNINKFYQALLMGLLMGAVEMGMILTMDKKSDNHDVYLKFFFVLLVGSLALFLVIRKQIGVGQKQFLSSMIEHHGMAIAMTEKVKPKVKNAQLCNLANNIINSQKKEIEEMKFLLSNYEENLSHC